MKKRLQILILIIVVLIVFLLLFLLSSKKENPADLWRTCNPQTNNCKNGLVCKRLGVTDIYRCVQYLEEGDECGISEAKICGEGLTCVKTSDTRTRCGTFSINGGQECFTEPVEICKPL